MALAVLASAGLSSCGGSEVDPTTVAPTAADSVDQAEALRNDPWVEELFNHCVIDTYFEKDTSDTVGLLLPKLEGGREQPLKRAMEELGSLGDRSVHALSQLAREQRNDPNRSGSIQNTIVALGLNPSPFATDVLLELREHPQSVVRQASLNALKQRALPPESYDALRTSALFSSGQIQMTGVDLMHRADPERAEAEFLDWLRTGRVPRLEERMIELLLQTESSEIRRELVESERELPVRAKIWFAAAMAQEGDMKADAEYREALAEPHLPFRIVAVQAAIACGDWDAVRSAARQDPDFEIRRMAVLALSGLVTKEETRAEAYPTLRRLMDDQNPMIADQAMTALAAEGDPEAGERLLARLDGGPSEVSNLFAVLRVRIAIDPNFADRMERRLLDRLDEAISAGEPPALPTIQLLGLLPSTTAVDRLLEVARTAKGEGRRIGNLPAHRWILVQVANSGEVGRAHLAELVPELDDQIEKLDYIWAIGASRDDLAREALTRIVEDDSEEQLIRLFAASKLLNVGPAEYVAPLLERVALRLEGEPRRGIQCLLHYWY